MSSSTQATTSNRATQQQQNRHIDYDIEDSIKRKKAEECVQYILYCYLAERKAIIRRADLNKNVIKEHSKSFREIFQLVEKYMLDVFGLRCIDLDGNDKFEKFGLRSKFKFDFDLNKCDNVINKRLAKHGADSHENDREFQDQLKYSMIMISLSLIFMNDNEIDEQVFFDSLKKLDISRDEKKHKYLGDVHKYFTSELVKDGYLEYEQVKNSEPPQYKLKWGYRAKLEISKKSVLDFVCDVYGGKDACKPDEWVAQYNDACKNDNDFPDDDSDGEEMMEESDYVENKENNGSRQSNLTQQQRRTQTQTQASSSRRTRTNVVDDLFESQSNEQQSQVVVKTQSRMRK